MNAPVQKKACCPIAIQDQDYNDVTFGIIYGLCGDVILGQDFLKRHKYVIIRMNDPQENLVVLNNKLNAQYQFQVLNPDLFSRYRQQTFWKSLVIRFAPE